MSITLPISDLSIIILAGGKSSRMGANKALLKLNSDTFIDRVIKVSKTLTNKVFISMADESQLINTEIPVVYDVCKNKGPIGGVTSVLPYIKTPWFMVLSVDSPMISIDSLLHLWYSKSNYEIVLYQVNSQKHPLLALYKIETKQKWDDALLSNQLKIMEIVNTSKKIIIEASKKQEISLKNINTIEEYQSLIQIYNHEN